MTHQLPQHMPSNYREPTDKYLHPSHYPFEDSIHQEIRLLKEGFEYIEITQERIAQIREESGNVKNYGDAVEEILYKELNSYEGMEDAHKLTEEKIFEMLVSEENVEGGVKKKKVFETLYDSNTKSTYYFLKG